ncbi:peroxiredoxin [Verrucomicrobium sp. 3C]|uniref:peroxiredoxin n=1 Tax=Verrucomicrobium sp. 3C TaxID=1134055 RepID=UPI000371F6F7|nr:peroxiredoxin [Verrucomicrobium sp. 3C]
METASGGAAWPRADILFSKNVLGVITLFAFYSFMNTNLAITPLALGAAAPIVHGTDQSGNEVDLAEASRNAILLLYFYPKADTPGCTKESCGLRDAYQKFVDHGVRVFGVSMDTVASQKHFVEKYHLPFTLLADPEGKIVDAFGVAKRNGHATRQSFLIRNGKIIWHDAKVNPETHAKEVLREIERHSS